MSNILSYVDYNFIKYFGLHFPGNAGSWNPSNDDLTNATDNAADEIMDRIVKSATQVPSQRAVPKERKRSRANRKSSKLN